MGRRGKLKDEMDDIMLDDALYWRQAFLEIPGSYGIAQPILDDLKRLKSEPFPTKDTFKRLFDILCAFEYSILRAELDDDFFIVKVPSEERTGRHNHHGHHIMFSKLFDLEKRYREINDFSSTDIA